ncbi:MAG: hypothetical protein A2138_25815 [Deltaproteobacteria bacterium RBG_16_71_12]|nr:MAG: hypothetical protein A2138_25815 [Deltaproteobacteria bacterium RBG_16_71_12]
MIMRTFFLALSLIAGPAYADDSCSLAGDAACDELAGCALGSDTSDCQAACAAGSSDATFGVCAHYSAMAAVMSEPATPGSGTRGEGGPRGLWSGTINARGKYATEQIVRHYEVYVPISYDPRRPTPLVMVLGGFTVDMYGLPAYTELLRTADLGGFIVVFPQQHYYNFGPSIGWVFAWNIYPTDWVPNGDWLQNPDVDFIRNLIDELGALYNLDRTRVIASGHSRGAGMSIILAFVLTDRVAGFLSEAGFADANGFDDDMLDYTGERRIPGVLVHGTADPDVPFSSSERVVEVLEQIGEVEGEDFLFFDLDHVAHEWQPQYNQDALDFLFDRPLPGGAP